LISTTGYVFVDGAIYIYLPVVEQGIIAFNAKLHTGNTFNTNYPVAQILIGPDIGLSAAMYKKLTVTTLSIAVRVGSINLVNTPNSPKRDTLVQHFDGLKKLVIQNDTAAATPVKHLIRLPQRQYSAPLSTLAAMKCLINRLASLP